MSGGLREVLALYLDESDPAHGGVPEPPDPQPAGRLSESETGCRTVLAIPSRRSDLVEPMLLGLLAAALTDEGLQLALYPGAAYTAPALGLGARTAAPWAGAATGEADLLLAPFAAEQLDNPAARLPPLDRVLLWIAGHPAGLQNVSRLLDRLAKRRPGARVELVFLGARNPAEAATCFQRLALPRDRKIALRHLAVLPSGPWLARMLIRGSLGEAPREFHKIARQIAQA